MAAVVIIENFFFGFPRSFPQFRKIPSPKGSPAHPTTPCGGWLGAPDYVFPKPCPGNFMFRTPISRNLQVREIFFGRSGCFGRSVDPG